MSQNAKLRVCASCEWIFDVAHQHPDTGGCPKCSFGHYGARSVYGNKAYAYAESQKPWYDKKLSAYALTLHKEIQDTNPVKPVRAIGIFKL